MIKGSCLCKSISYQIDEEIRELIFCHCSFCRKSTASAYSVNARVSKSCFEILEGEAFLVNYCSSKGKERYYCKVCHSQLFHLQDVLPDFITLKVGTIDYWEQELSEVVKKHIHRDSKYDWLFD